MLSLPITEAFHILFKFPVCYSVSHTKCERLEIQFFFSFSNIQYSYLRIVDTPLVFVNNNIQRKNRHSKRQQTLTNNS